MPYIVNDEMEPFFINTANLNRPPSYIEFPTPSPTSLDTLVEPESEI